MFTLKCKMCGGDIKVEAGQKYGECSFCGSRTTVPGALDGRRANLFNRADHFRRQFEFDKAIEAYDRILDEDGTDAEAHWRVALCRYGVEYVEDPATQRRVPTCHRAIAQSILSDADYLAALEHAADGYTRSLYEADAKAIDDVQKGILALARSEAPFDVFICYKEADDAGGRTKDSVIAQDIYYQLTKAGYKVFFSRVTLESKLGTEYEPYIFSALNSARVMLVVGTKPEYFNSVWVKNEWSRYLDIAKRDGRLVIPCYKDMNPYDLPDALAALQSQDMGKIGFMQDLLHGVKKVLDADKPEHEASEGSQQGELVSQPREANPNIAPLLKRGHLFLEEGDFARAEEYFERVLDADPECAAAYMGKYLVENELRSEDGIADGVIERINDSNRSCVLPGDSKNYKNALRFANRAQASAWTEQADRIAAAIAAGIEQHRKKRNRRAWIFGVAGAVLASLGFVNNEAGLGWLGLGLVLIGVIQLALSDSHYFRSRGGRTNAEADAVAKPARQKAAPVPPPAPPAPKRGGIGCGTWIALAFLLALMGSCH
ncbi:MAG: TIR domain-containing protein [Synergistaceae bacterium]|nr:TIR domain-containing protein [Synergistaceae bacterium]